MYPTRLRSLSFVSLTAGMFLLVFATLSAQPPLSAKVLFHDPMCGQPPAAPHTATSRRFPPVHSTTCHQPDWPRFRFAGHHYYPRYIGIHYWFENERGERFADIRKAGAKPRLHVRSNVGAFLTVWKADARAQGLQLTPMESAYAGIVLKADTEYIVPGDLSVLPTGSTRLLFWLSRSQTEQVDNPSEARERIQHRMTEVAFDGGPAQVRESDSTTRGEIGTYVVNRQGDQVGEEIVIAP